MNDQTTALFRCVCGQAIDVSEASGGSCTNCGRRYASQIDDMAATTTLVANRQKRNVPEDEMVGKKLDHFTIINRLGAGGMGVVYTALDESLQRYVH